MWIFKADSNIGLPLITLWLVLVVEMFDGKTLDTAQGEAHGLRSSWNERWNSYLSRWIWKHEGLTLTDHVLGFLLRCFRCYKKLKLLKHSSSLVCHFMFGGFSLGETHDVLSYILSVKNMHQRGMTLALDTCVEILRVPSLEQRHSWKKTGRYWNAILKHQKQNTYTLSWVCIKTPGETHNQPIFSWCCQIFLHHQCEFVAAVFAQEMFVKISR